MARGLVLVLSFFALSCGAAQQPLPAPEHVIQLMLDRSQAVAKAVPTNHWTYDKKSVTRELASNGSAKSTIERLYRVTVIKGVPFSRLVKVAGKDLSPDELEKEDKREAEFRKRVSGLDPDAVARGKTPLIGKDLVARFEYQVVRRENLRNGPALLVNFRPKVPRGPEKTIHDRVLNRLAGRFWVDEQTGEVASMDVRLTEGFSLGFLGMLGSARSFELHIRRIGMPDGAWVPELVDARFVGRIVLSTESQHLREQSSNYSLQPAQAFKSAAAK